MTHIFTFDVSTCTGCKDCQSACVEKNHLPAGVLWRRVYAIGETDVAAYSLSIACNHCVHPKCAGVCPTDAYVQREDGIVYIDESKCMGCGYCAWACPYNAPRYDPELGRMTKCNFCMDNLAAGQPPACVAACQPRSLGFMTKEEGQSDQPSSPVLSLWSIPAAEHPFPLPTFSRTQPHLAIRPHAGMLDGCQKAILNGDEIKPFRRSELPLVIFTILAQMAVGAFWALPLLLTSLWLLVQSDALPLRVFAGLVIGGTLGLAGLASFLHLGTPKNAWRALSHLKKSSMSREILLVGLFTAGWLAWMLAALTRIWAPGLEWVVALLGAGLIHGMAQVYRLRSMPAWNTWRTPAAFFGTALALGPLLACGVLVIESAWTGITIAGKLIPWVGGWLVIVLGGVLGLHLSAGDQYHLAVYRLRGGLLLAGIVLSAGLLFSAGSNPAGLVLSLFSITLFEELLGRWVFYSHLQRRSL